MLRVSRTARNAGSPPTRAVLVLLLAALPLAVAPPALAHDQLVASSPADGATVGAVPATVDLTYSTDVLPTGAVVEVRDASGADRAVGSPTIGGPIVSVAVDAAAPDGAYTVLWRVVSSDGHPIEGTFGFTVTLPAAVAAATPTPTPTPTPTAGPTPTATATISSTDDEPGVTPRVPPLLMVLVAVGAIGAVAAATIAGFRRRS